MKAVKLKYSPGYYVSRWVLRLFLFAWGLTIAFPMVWTIYTSFKTNKEFFANVWALPKKLSMVNYAYAWNTAKFSAYFLNSLIVVAISVAVQLLITSTTSYAITRFRFRAVGAMKRFYLVAMTVPGVLVLVPQYFMFLNMGLTNNLIVVALLHALGSLPGNIIMQTAFMRGVDNALFEAADMDGASEFNKFFGIMVPCVKNCLFLTALTGTLGAWNDYITPLTYIDDEMKYTVSIGLSHLQTATTYGVQYGGLFAGLSIAMIPILIVYAVFQKPLRDGLESEGGVKG